MVEFTSKSGKTVIVNKAPFEAARLLWASIQLSAAEQKMSSDFLQEPESLFTLILRIDSSESFNSALWPCLIRCTRDNKKIDKTTFDDMEARGEYYEIITRCVEENIGPFVESLFSELGARMVALAMKKNLENPPKQS